MAPPVTKKPKKSAGKKKQQSTTGSVVEVASTGGETAFPKGIKEEKKRTANFLPDEDEFLAKAWCAASVNPVKGCNQKAHEFWQCVQKDYELLQVRAVNDGDQSIVSCYREWAQLKTRFMRHIQPNVNSFNRQYKWAYDHLPSGTPKTVPNVMKLAMQVYKQEYGHEFRFELCVPVLHKMPKFDPFITQTVIDVDTVASGSVRNDVGAGMMGGGLERPIGCKAAKALKKAGEQQGGEVKQIRLQFEELVKTVRRRAAVDELAKLAKSYMISGDVEMAKEATAAMRDLIASPDVQKDDVSFVTGTQYVTGTPAAGVSSSGGRCGATVTPTDLRTDSCGKRDATTALANDDGRNDDDDDDDALGVADGVIHGAIHNLLPHLHTPRASPVASPITCPGFGEDADSIAEESFKFRRHPTKK
jgi:hypothetical protein